MGDNAFAHEAGIHQDGYLKERTTYEIMEPHTVGVPETKLVLGKHSGRHALNKRAADLGFSLSHAELDDVVPALHGARRSQKRHSERRDHQHDSRADGRSRGSRSLSRARVPRTA